MNLKRSNTKTSLYKESIFLQTIQQDGLYDQYIKDNHLDMDLKNYIQRCVDTEPFIEVGLCETDHGRYRVDIEQYKTIVLTDADLNIQKLPMEEPLSEVEKLYLYCSKYKKTEEDPTTAFEVIVESRNLKKQYQDQAISYQMDKTMELDGENYAQWQKETAIEDLLNPQPNRQDVWKKNFEEDFLKEYFHRVIEPYQLLQQSKEPKGDINELMTAFTSLSMENDVSKTKTKVKK